MTPLEIIGWNEHLRRYPPGDFMTQLILAQLYTLILNLFSKKTHKTAHLFPFLSYLLGDSEAKQDSQREFMMMQQQAIVADIYKKNKERQSKE